MLRPYALIPMLASIQAPVRAIEYAFAANRPFALLSQRASA
ncbi:hypothetical protein GLA29479_2704 [Lysobacter antibioticus]|nr:hypothetical protein GLA29479_2704 [Lysobacter antibioticus]